MKIQTMSIVCGTRACNANCPFCVSKMTPEAELHESINWHNLRKACQLAKIGGATTVLITGKGEPTLHPMDILMYLRHLREWGEFPFIELQTNGIELMGSLDKDDLEQWYIEGLNTICLSAVHYESRYNKQIYGDKYHSLPNVVSFLHNIGFTVRLSVMMIKDYIDTWEKVVALAQYCREEEIDQLTIRPITGPTVPGKSEVADWVEEHKPDDTGIVRIKNKMREYATPVLHLSHGAVVYDFDGQNICLSNCLTTNETADDIRQIIFYPNGRIAYDWKYKGAILL